MNNVGTYSSRNGQKAVGRKNSDEQNGKHLGVAVRLRMIGYISELKEPRGNFLEQISTSHCTSCLRKPPLC